jgi:hypothetical protein
MACTMMSPRPVPRSAVTPSPRSVMVSPDWVPRAHLDRLRPVEGLDHQRRPRAAAVIGSSTVACRSSPRRWKVGCGATRELDVEVTGRAAAVADLALTGELDPGAVVDAGRHLERSGCGGSAPGRGRSTRSTGWG